MHGNAIVRHCDDCEKKVYNISMLSKPEIDQLVLETEGKFCARYYYRSDGTIITSDCPKGLRQARLALIKLRFKAAAGFAALVAMLGFSASSSVTRAKSELSKKWKPTLDTPVASGYHLTGDTIFIDNKVIDRQPHASCSVTSGIVILKSSEVNPTDSSRHELHSIKGKTVLPDSHPLARDSSGRSE